MTCPQARPPRRQRLRAGVAVLLLSAALTSPAAAGPIPGAPDRADGLPALLLEPDPASDGPSADRAADPAADAQAALAALRHGRWQRACDLATAVLASRQPDVDAAGLFGICRAVANDRSSADVALVRLREVDPRSHYIPMIHGVLQLLDKSPDRARPAFEAVLKARPGDALAQYFVGEAWHARGQDARALAAFQAAYATWPEFAPALTAAARLMATRSASQATLVQARALAERATAQDPTQRKQWLLLADLCQRTGQTARAHAIRLQWSSVPPLVKAPPG